MVGFDTHVLARVLVGDEPTQTKKAEHAFLRHPRGDGIWVSLVVLVELAWVLSSGYELDRTTIHERLTKIVRTRGVMVESLELVQDALGAFLAGKADLAAYIILGKTRSAGATALLTFDRKFSREEGVNLL